MAAAPPPPIAVTPFQLLQPWQARSGSARSRPTWHEDGTTDPDSVTVAAACDAAVFSQHQPTTGHSMIGQSLSLWTKWAIMVVVRINMALPKTSIDQLGSSASFNARYWRLTRKRHGALNVECVILAPSNSISSSHAPRTWFRYYFPDKPVTNTTLTNNIYGNNGGTILV